ncbi:MAG: hypothetical protein HY245_11135 [Rhizobiales bacterium]|nr:hypothetical protein [Hyphomicrobiales bacterium]MBI3673948.1 hypothetical protein [Hyphomicrobiales bacterium]
MTGYTLIIIHRGPEYERDFKEIAQKVVDIDPTIKVYYCPFDAAGPMPAAAWEKPTLVVALNPTFALPIPRGTVLKSFAISKLAQAKRVANAGVRVPSLLPFKFGMKLDPIMFGPLVILKPMSLTSKGTGVHLFRRVRAEAIAPGDFPAGHPIHRDREGYLAQKFIDTGSHITYNRVLTFLGEPIYAASGSHTTPRPPLDSPDPVLETAAIAVQGGTLRRQWGVADDLMAMARKVGQEFAEIPLLAIDIITEAATGIPYFLECNPGGNTWHFSSNQGGGIKLRLLLGDVEKNGRRKALELGRREMIDQTGAFDIVARALVEKTRALAS